MVTAVRTMRSGFCSHARRCSAKNVSGSRPGSRSCFAQRNGCSRPMRDPRRAKYSVFRMRWKGALDVLLRARLRGACDFEKSSAGAAQSQERVGSTVGVDHQDELKTERVVVAEAHERRDGVNKVGPERGDQLFAVVNDHKRRLRREHARKPDMEHAPEEPANGLINVALPKRFKNVFHGVFYLVGRGSSSSSSSAGSLCVHMRRSRNGYLSFQPVPRGFRVGIANKIESPGRPQPQQPSRPPREPFVDDGVRKKS